jgi:hypothetical protein
VLVIHTNAPEAPRVEVTMTGRGLDRHIAVSSLSIEFPAVYRNPVVPASIGLQISNTGERPLALSGMALTGSGAESFSLSGELPLQIAPLASAELRVQFAPRSAGPDRIRAALELLSDDDDRPLVRVDLSGQGRLPAIEASASQLDFGTVAVGLEVLLPDAAPLTLWNRGETDSFTVKRAVIPGVEDAVEIVVQLRTAVAVLKVVDVLRLVAAEVVLVRDAVVIIILIRSGDLMNPGCEAT